MNELGPLEEPLFSDWEALTFALKSALSLRRDLPDRPGVIYRPLHLENARTPETLPLNIEEVVLNDFLTTIRDRDIKATNEHRPYWNRSIEYNSAEVFGAAVQLLDLHDEPLPRTVLPPESDVMRFINGIRRKWFIDGLKARPYQVKVDEQLNLALDITGNDLLGALNLAWIGTRLMARGADQRAYPNIPISADTVRDWNTQVAQFEVYDTSGKCEATGDTYYFWTHAFAAVAFANRGYKAKLAQLAFSRGTQIMHYAFRNKPQAIITSHQPASAIGRQVGLALANLRAYEFEDSKR